MSDIVYHRYPRKREASSPARAAKSCNVLRSTNSLPTSASTASSRRRLNRDRAATTSAETPLKRLWALCTSTVATTTAQWFIEKRIIGRLLDIDGVANKEVNFKSKLLEWTQKNRILAEYKLEEKADENNGTQFFHSSVVLEGIVAGTGEGHSKKESQQIAAKEALTKLRREPKFLDSIYRAKEKRTAMEADEVCVVPRIDEIEEEIAQEAKPHVSRNAKTGTVAHTESEEKMPPNQPLLRKRATTNRQQALNALRNRPLTTRPPLPRQSRMNSPNATRAERSSRMPPKRT